MKKTKIIVTFECDEVGNHMCKLGDIVGTSSLCFSDQMDAIHFIAECTSCNHNLRDIAPELFTWECDETECSNIELETYLFY